jgi:hypothetical protein
MTTRGADYLRRKNDDYPTPIEVTQALFDNVELGPIIFDPACGHGQQILKAARKCKLGAYGNDIVLGQDFLTTKYRGCPYNYVTNPPYGDRRGTLALRFIEHALALTKPHKGRVAMLLPIDFDSGKTRTHVFQHPAFTSKLVLLDRIKWFDGQSGSTNHAWFIWDWENQGPPIIRYARIDSTQPIRASCHR